MVDLNRLASSCVFTLDGEIEIETEPEIRFQDESVDAVPYTDRRLDLMYRDFNWGYYDYTTYNDFQYDLKA